VIEALIAQIRPALHGHGLVRAIRVEDRLIDQLFPEEAALVSRAVSKRKRELAAGRVLARALLAELGFEPRPLLSREDRTPIWPEGVVGSITHCSSACVVAVARSHELSALGIDIEEDTPLGEHLVPMIATVRERRWLDGRSPDRGVFGKLVFSAKESTYKAQYAITGRMLDFPQVELDVDPALGTFAAEVVEREARALLGDRRLSGRFARGEGYLLTAVALPLDSSSGSRG
jgi:4'-phosphopantetheinyl transferase EntD